MEKVLQSLPRRGPCPCREPGSELGVLCAQIPSCPSQTQVSGSRRPEPGAHHHGHCPVALALPTGRGWQRVTCLSVPQIPQSIDENAFHTPQSPTLRSCCFPKGTGPDKERGKGEEKTPPGEHQLFERNGLLHARGQAGPATGQREPGRGPEGTASRPQGPSAAWAAILSPGTTSSGSSFELLSRVLPPHGAPLLGPSFLVWIGGSALSFSNPTRGGMMGPTSSLPLAGSLRTPACPAQPRLGPFLCFHSAFAQFTTGPVCVSLWLWPLARNSCSVCTREQVLVLSQACPCVLDSSQ